MVQCDGNVPANGKPGIISWSILHEQQPLIVVGKEKRREKDYLCSFQVIVLGSTIAAVTQECTLL